MTHDEAVTVNLVTGLTIFGIRLRTERLIGRCAWALVDVQLAVGGEWVEVGRLIDDDGERCVSPAGILHAAEQWALKRQLTAPTDATRVRRACESAIAKALTPPTVAEVDRRVTYAAETMSEEIKRLRAENAALHALVAYADHEDECEELHRLRAACSCGYSKAWRAWAAHAETKTS